MRPRELRVQGFRSYRDSTTFDFRGRRLIGVVGPIGAGKSSLLDAIAFALYGKTPAFESGTRSLIHQLEDVAHVELIFEVDGQIWRAQRGIRRKGQSGHKLERLAEDAPGAAVLESVQQERAVRERVVRLLGLDFSAFCRSVLLAQNRFSEFLRAAPRERTEVLKGVFGYERFDAALVAARERVAAAEASLAMLEREGARLREARESFVAASAEAETTAARSDAFERARPQVETLRTRRAEARASRAEATDRMAALERAGAGLPEGDAVTSTLASAERAAEGVLAAEAAVAEAERALRAAEEERDAAAERAEDVMPFATLLARKDAEAAAVTDASQRLAVSQAALEAAEGARTLAEDAATVADDEVTTTGEAAAAASAAIDAATGALQEAQHQDRATSLRRHLIAGEPCPVCAQIVARVPVPGDAIDMERAEEALETAQARRASADRAEAATAEALATCRARRHAAGERAETARTDLAGAGEAVQRAEAALAATQGEIVERLGEGDPHALVEARMQERRAADERVREAAAVATAARADRDDATSAHGRTVDDLASLASRIAGAWGLLGEQREPVAGDGAVRAAFVELGQTIIDRTAGAADVAEAAAVTEREAGAALASVLAELALPPGADFTDALADARARRDVAEERRRAIATELEAGADLDARTAAATARSELTRRLRDDLQPARFLAWILEEERAALAEVGSVHLDQLTAGAFRFAGDDSFRIVDVNGGGMERPSDSLSGGETFLASLALALGLAEMVARGGGRLDAFFLDEGFGSLDPDHLERAMDGIGRLVAADDRRLVVIVSHVEQMRQMLEDLIVLDKDERTGQTRVLAGAGPAAPAG